MNINATDNYVENKLRIKHLVVLCVCTSIHREGFICLDRVGYHGTDQRCSVENVNFLCQVLSSLLYNAGPNLSN